MIHIFVFLLLYKIITSSDCEDYGGAFCEDAAQAPTLCNDDNVATLCPLTCGFCSNEPETTNEDVICSKWTCANVIRTGEIELEDIIFCNSEPRICCAELNFNHGCYSPPCWFLGDICPIPDSNGPDPAEPRIDTSYCRSQYSENECIAGVTERSDWLTQHNRERCLFFQQPLQWSEWLAQISLRFAQDLAKLHGCSIFHDENGWLIDPWNGGENLNANANTGGLSLPDSAFQVIRGTWSDAEKGFCDLSTGFCDRERASHFTQVVSSLSTHVGCANWNFQDNDWSCTISVCRYVSNGNQYLGSQFLGSWPTPWNYDQAWENSCRQQVWPVDTAWKPWPLDLEEEWFNPTPSPTPLPTLAPTVSDVCALPFGDYTNVVTISAPSACSTITNPEFLRLCTCLTTPSLAYFTGRFCGPLLHRPNSVWYLNLEVNGCSFSRGDFNSEQIAFDVFGFCGQNPTYFPNVAAEYCEDPFCLPDGDFGRTKAGETARLPCEGDYFGDIIRACSAVGHWGLITEDCYKYCPEDGDFPKSRGNLDIRIPCPDGYSGVKSRICSQEGVWGIEIDWCTRLMCQDDGLFTETLSKEDGILLCADGSELSRRCLNDGRWSSIDANELALCLDPPDPTTTTTSLDGTLSPSPAPSPFPTAEALDLTLYSSKRLLLIFGASTDDVDYNSQLALVDVEASCGLPERDFVLVLVVSASVVILDDVRIRHFDPSESNYLWDSYANCARCFRVVALDFDLRLIQTWTEVVQMTQIFDAVDAVRDMTDVDFSHVDGCGKEADGGWSMSLETRTTTSVFQSIMLSSFTNTRFLLFFVDDEAQKSTQLSEWESETHCGFYDRRIATALVELPASFADVSVTSVGDPTSIETASYPEASDLFQEYSSCEIINDCLEVVLIDIDGSVIASWRDVLVTNSNLFATIDATPTRQYEMILPLDSLIDANIPGCLRSISGGFQIDEDALLSSLGDPIPDFIFESFVLMVFTPTPNGDMYENFDEEAQNDLTCGFYDRDLIYVQIVGPTVTVTAPIAGSPLTPNTTHLSTGVATSLWNHFTNADCVQSCFTIAIFDETTGGSDSAVPYYSWVEYFPMGSILDLVDTFESRVWAMQVSKPSLVQGLVPHCTEEPNGGWRSDYSPIESSTFCASGFSNTSLNGNHVVTQSNLDVGCPRMHSCASGVCHFYGCKDGVEISYCLATTLSECFWFKSTHAQKRGYGSDSGVSISSGPCTFSGVNFLLAVETTSEASSGDLNDTEQVLQYVVIGIMGFVIFAVCLVSCCTILCSYETAPIKKNDSMELVRYRSSSESSSSLELSPSEDMSDVTFDDGFAVVMCDEFDEPPTPKKRHPESAVLATSMQKPMPIKPIIATKDEEISFDKSHTGSSGFANYIDAKAEETNIKEEIAQTPKSSGLYQGLMDENGNFVVDIGKVISSSLSSRGSRNSSSLKKEIPQDLDPVPDSPSELAVTPAGRLPTKVDSDFSTRGRLPTVANSDVASTVYLDELQELLVTGDRVYNREKRKRMEEDESTSKKRASENHEKANELPPVQKKRHPKTGSKSREEKPLKHEPGRSSREEQTRKRGEKHRKEEVRIEENEGDETQSSSQKHDSRTLVRVRQEQEHSTFI